MNNQSLRETVQNQYAAVARSGLSNDSAAVRSVAQAFGYSVQDLASLPPQANMGLSCGNPLAVAGLRPGEVVVDLGCGGGLDVLLAAKQVGPTGKAIGVDMTPEMIARARAGAAQVGATNVEFHLAEIDRLPLPDASADCVISNCVINLAPDKPKVFREILRVLKPGGRVAISDIALRQPLPPEVAANIQAYVGCISGAVLIADYARMLREAGFDAVVASDTGADLNVYAVAGSGGCCTTLAGGCCTSAESAEAAPALHDGLAQVLKDFDVNAYAASVRVHAVKSSSAEPAGSTKEAEEAVRTVQVFDKPTCCSKGVCAPQVDPAPARFAADLEWLESQGHRVERYNLAQQPNDFIRNSDVHQLLATHGTTCLPIVLVDGQIVSKCGYPSRAALGLWTGARSAQSLPVTKQPSECCSGASCC